MEGTPPINAGKLRDLRPLSNTVRTKMCQIPLLVSDWVPHRLPTRVKVRQVIKQCVVIVYIGKTYNDSSSTNASSRCSNLKIIQMRFMWNYFVLRLINLRHIEFECKQALFSENPYLAGQINLLPDNSIRAKRTTLPAGTLLAWYCVLM